MVDVVSLPWFTMTGLGGVADFTCFGYLVASEIGSHVGLLAVILRLTALLFAFEIQKNLLQAEQARDIGRKRPAAYDSKDSAESGALLSNRLEREKQEAALISTPASDASAFSDVEAPVPALSDWRESWFTRHRSWVYPRNLAKAVIVYALILTGFTLSQLPYADYSSVCLCLVFFTDSTVCLQYCSATEPLSVHVTAFSLTLL